MIKTYHARMTNEAGQQLTIVCRLDGRKAMSDLMAEAVEFARCGSHAGFIIYKGSKLVQRVTLPANGNVVCH